MMQTLLLLTFGALVLSGCVSRVAAVPRGPMVVDGVAYDVAKTSSGALRVERQGRPFGNWEGAEARRAADQFCVGRANASIKDRFQGTEWLIVGGCA